MWSGTTHKKFIFAPIIFAISGCGAVANQYKGITPDENFLDAAEQTSFARRCLIADASGCSQVDARGSALHGDFSFKDLYTSCQSTNDGTVIQLKNAVSQTFQVNLSFYRTNPTPGVYSCLGPEYSQTSPTYVLKDGFCQVQAQVHNRVFSTSLDESCSVEILEGDTMSGYLECQQMTSNGVYLSIADTSHFACQDSQKSDNSLPVLDHPSFVQTEVHVAGTEAQEKYAPKVTSYKMEIKDCTTAEVQSIEVNDASKKNLLNLEEGDKGCRAYLKSFTYQLGKESFEFFSADGSPWTGDAGTETNFVTADESRHLLVSIGTQLRQELLHNELASFFILPTLQTIGTDAFLSRGEFVSTGEKPPYVTLSSLAYAENSSTTKEIEIILSCDNPLILFSCESQNIFDYRARLIEMGSLTPTEPEIAAAMNDISTEIRPTVAHYFGNGLRFFQTLDVNTPPTKKFIFIVRINHSYRYFILDGSNIL